MWRGRRRRRRRSSTFICGGRTDGCEKDKMTTRCGASKRAILWDIWCNDWRKWNISEILSNFVALMMIETARKDKSWSRFLFTAIKAYWKQITWIEIIMRCGWFTSKKIISKILVFGSIKKIYKLNKAIWVSWMNINDTLLNVQNLYSSYFVQIIIYWEENLQKMFKISQMLIWSFKT